MINAELALTALVAMLSPTTLSFSVLALLLGDKPRRTGIYFYLGAMGATLAVGVVAAFVLGDKAASHNTSTPKTWVAMPDLQTRCNEQKDTVARPGGRKGENPWSSRPRVTGPELTAWVGADS